MADSPNSDAKRDLENSPNGPASPPDGAIGANDAPKGDKTIGASAANVNTGASDVGIPGGAETGSGPAIPGGAGRASFSDTTDLPANDPRNTDPLGTGETAGAGAPSYDYSSYYLPEDDADSLVVRARTWVEENPLLAIAGAAGIGLLFGRAVLSAIPEPEPPSLAERVEKRTRVLRKDAEKYAKQAKKTAKKKSKVYGKKAEVVTAAGGALLAERLHAAAEAISDAADHAAEYAETGYERAQDYAETGIEKTKDFAEIISDAVKAAIAGGVVAQTDRLIDKIKR
jgi:hypothetical protein